ncbi:S-methyl-5-thioribose-1-phosphate isomerase [candidate division KSB1 bacterium]|nr:S-methyl-5-thioribose-1-phosphate isomerase [candidate division KSB1 bacterium]RQW05753.1 MAG: S-methyl-5-thioribose-1-phosphate isomerase [candidate division KSB1 bacterium]
MKDLHAVSWLNGKVRLLDQTKLPEELILLEISDYRHIVSSIKNLVVRGAPAIGIAAAFGVVLSVWNADESDRAEFLTRVNTAIDELKGTRPTAKNLFWALEKMRNTLSRNLSRPLRHVKEAMLKEAQAILQDDIDRCRRIGDLGQELLPLRATVLTHCNAGALATGGHGTALGIIRSAIEKGKKIKVFADETRPLLQGARLTTFELLEDDIDVTLITDNTAAFAMKKGLIDIVVVGADRIARNGDVANKVGTYGLSILAKEHKIPFVVAAPLSTFDREIENGDEIPIEERDANEVRFFGSTQAAPEDVPVYNPAFDVTPHNFISAIVTEKGIVRFPNAEKLAALLK